MQGSTIALQTYARNDHWLNCISPKTGFCATGNCPKLFMEGQDWQNCPENVFEVYNTFSRTKIFSHYPIGLYFPVEKVWFSIEQSKGKKTSCPGKPSMETGFEKSVYWKDCSSAVFQMMAKGRKAGDEIQNGDIVFLYSYYNHRYVRIEKEGTPVLSNCPDINQEYSFDECYNEVLRLTIE